VQNFSESVDLQLSHLNDRGEAKMVDVADKAVTNRTAVAAGRVRMSASTLAAILAGNAPKGDVLGTARIAGIMAAKQTARKVAIFGSARTRETAPEYQMAEEFARAITQQGFMAITGGGGGIMAAANAGAGMAQSFGLNIQLPSEQGANKYISGDPKSIEFKYFFTRKLFFLRESDAVALFPGGFGTQDEAMETLTLCQTGRYGPVPLVLIDRPGGSYWRDWDSYLRKHLAATGLIGQDDLSLYTITDNLQTAVATIRNFYQVYHSSRYVGDLFVIRLKVALCDRDLDLLNREFGDLVASGSMIQTQALAEEFDTLTPDLPRLVFKFDRRDFGRLYQAIGKLNQMGNDTCLDTHPESK
jgi:uncharacterized protein (TIGR00730 family)